MAIIHVLYWLNLLLSFLIGAYSLYALYYFVNPIPEDGHAGELALYVSGTLAALSLSFLFASTALKRSWKMKWALQAVPVSGLAFFLFT